MSAATVSRWPLAEGVVVATVALGALLFQLWLPSTHVDEADYLAVARVLEQEARPGDVVLLAPWWTERARLYVPPGLPVVGHQHSDGEALEAHPRIWVLSQPRLPRSGRSAFQAAFGPGRTPDGAAHRFGNLALQRYLNGRHRPVVFDGVEALPRARVALESADGQRQACSPGGPAHRCPNGRTVAAEWHEVAFAPYRCLRLDAPQAGTRLVVEYPEVPASDALVLEGGFLWDRSAYVDGVSDAELRLEVDGEAAALPLPRGVERMHRLERGGTREGAVVRVSLTAPNPNAREVCVVLRGHRRAP